MLPNVAKIGPDEAKLDQSWSKIGRNSPDKYSCEHVLSNFRAPSAGFGQELAKFAKNGQIPTSWAESGSNIPPAISPPPWTDAPKIRQNYPTNTLVSTCLSNFRTPAVEFGQELAKFGLRSKFGDQVGPEMVKLCPASAQIDRP